LSLNLYPIQGSKGRNRNATIAGKMSLNLKKGVMYSFGSGTNPNATPPVAGKKCSSFLFAPFRENCVKSATMKCPQCDMPFCCQECFKRCWKEHKTFHELKAEILANPTSANHQMMGIFLSEGAYVGEMRKDAKIIDGGDDKETYRSVKNSIDGRGTMRFRDGAKIDGHFSNGKAVAYSKLTSSSEGGEVYSGEYDEDNSPHGHGMRIYFNGDYFIGEWNRGRRVRGAMHDFDGLIVRDGECSPRGDMTTGVIRKREQLSIKGDKVLMPYGIKVANVVIDEEYEYEMHLTQREGYILGPVTFKFPNGDIFSCHFTRGVFDPTEPHEFRDSDGIVREGCLPPQVDPEMIRHELHPFPEGWKEEDGLLCSVVYVGKDQAVVERQRDGTNRSYLGVSQGLSFVVDVPGPVR